MWQEALKFFETPATPRARKEGKKKKEKATAGDDE
jgi:hypothetical protein